MDNSFGQQEQSLQVPLPKLLKNQQQAPKKKRSRFTTYLVVFLVVAVLAMGLLIGGYNYARNQMTTSAGTSTETKEFVIADGEGGWSISKQLKEEGLVSSAYVFQWLVIERGLSSYFQPGTYKLSPHMTMVEIADIVAHRKELALDRDVIFLEGWTLKQMIGEVKESTDIDPSDFENRVMHPHEFYDNYDFVKELPKDATLEGYLFPDTYRIDNTFTADVLILKMLSNFGKKFNYDLRETARDGGWVMHEVVILASILEREVQTLEDKKIVSGIFENRLNMGKRLEIDATINYGLELKPTLDSSNFTKTDSPYNTYIIQGLPPGPIANPGMDSITAVLEPKNSDFLFFLTVPGSGKVIYAKTFEEHQANIQQYLR